MSAHGDLRRLRNLPVDEIRSGYIGTTVSAPGRPESFFKPTAFAACLMSKPGSLIQFCASENCGLMLRSEDGGSIYPLTVYRSTV